MTKPSPDFIAALIAVMFIGIAVTFVVVIHNHKERKLSEALLNPPTCVSESGHKKVECP